VLVVVVIVELNFDLVVFVGLSIGLDDGLVVGTDEEIAVGSTEETNVDELLTEGRD